ncbi:hypothetical protein D918_08341 [Trichuris suis]|nr:hypothetical protein D918_08341 [Trichuris suis]
MPPADERCTCRRDYGMPHSHFFPLDVDYLTDANA